MAAASLRFISPPSLSSSSPSQYKRYRFQSTKPARNTSATIACSRSSSPAQSIDDGSRSDYKPGPFDDIFYKFFRKKMVEEVGWDSEKPGYDGLIEVANRLMVKSKSDIQTEKSAVRVLKSLFPPFLLPLFKMLITPIGRGKPAAIMLARATALSCQWLMGPCSVNFVELPDGSSYNSGVFVEKCKYLEESKCIGICINTCKLPTQTFFNDCMGVPLYMEPNFTDFSCQFNFGVPPPSRADDTALQQPCLEICPNASRRRELGRNKDPLQCPKV